jgi:hypothetical protein
MKDAVPVTPDGRYIVVRGRLWRRANPHLPEPARAALVHALMAARRAVGQARRAGDRAALAEAGQAVDAAKVALGERGPVWWTDGAPDLNRHMARTTPYAAWWLEAGASLAPPGRSDAQAASSRRSRTRT